MRDTGIATYTIRITENWQPDDYLVLSDFYNHQDFLDTLLDFVNFRSNDYYINNELQRVLRVENFAQRARTINGIIRKGEFGTVEPLLNIQTLQTPYIIQMEEAPMFPHYFLGIIPEGTDEGLLLLETSGRRGTKSNLSDDICLYFSTRFQNFRVRIEPVMPEELLRLYLEQGEINEILFTRFRIPGTDWYDEFDIQHNEEIKSTLSIQGKALVAVRERIRNFIRTRRNLDEFVALRNIEYEDVKVDFELHGKHRLISLNNPLSRGAVWDITNNPSLEFGDEGHPTLESIDRLARDFATDILANMGIDLNVR